jgi:hypothetical protein
MAAAAAADMLPEALRSGMLQWPLRLGMLCGVLPWGCPEPRSPQLPLLLLALPCPAGPEVPQLASTYPAKGEVPGTFATPSASVTTLTMLLLQLRE